MCICANILRYRIWWCMYSLCVYLQPQVLYITYIHTYLGDVSTGAMHAVAIEAVGALNEISSFLLSLFLSLSLSLRKMVKPRLFSVSFKT